MKRILIADDVAGWIRFHENNLRHLSDELEIDTAISAKEALAKVEVSIDEPYDTIFTDLQMESDFAPKLAGVWLIEQIQTFKEFENTKIVIISASPSIELIAKKYGVEYISKFTIRNSDAGIYKKYI